MQYSAVALTEHPIFTKSFLMTPGSALPAAHTAKPAKLGLSPISLIPYSHQADSHCGSLTSYPYAAQYAAYCACASPAAGVAPPIPGVAPG